MSPSPPDGPEEQSKPERGVRVKIVCSHCDRVFTRHSRRGYTATCPHCHTVNAGPALLAEQGKGKAEGARRRLARRERATERAADGHGGAGDPRTGELGRRHETPSAPAPVRRRRSSAQAGGAATPTAAPAAGETPSQGAPPPGRRGFFDSLFYGDGDDGE